MTNLVQFTRVLRTRAALVLGPAQRTSSSASFLAIALLTSGALCCANANASCKGSATLNFLRSSAQARVLPVQAVSQQSSQNTASNDGDDVSIVGFWRVHFLSGGQVFDDGFDQWHSDGLEILNDSAPPAPANGTGNVCLGVYKKIGPRTYKSKHPFFSFDANGNLVGTGVILEQIIVALSGYTYSGSFTWITYDLNGSTTSEVTGELQADRITAD